MAASWPFFFVVGVLKGDNQGLCCICGFCESHAAKFFCRMCKVDLEKTKKLIKEDVSLQRTPRNYAGDVVTNNFLGHQCERSMCIRSDPFF